ncbi:MAG: MlaD family protein [Candidatus Omnitrophota bacterium]
MIKNIWEKKQSLMYIKIGSFFIIGFFLFFVTLLSIREVSFFEGSYNIIVKFEFVEGLRSSSPVRFCGVDVGEIKKVSVIEEKNEPWVYVHAKIENGIQIPKGSYFFVNSLSLFGEKYLEITPSGKVTTYINKGDIVEGISPIPLFSVFSTFTKTMEEVQMFVEEGKLKNSLENIFKNTENLTSELQGLIEDMKNKKGTVGKLLYDDSLYKTTEEFIADLKAHPWKLLHKPKATERNRK